MIFNHKPSCKLGAGHLIVASMLAVGVSKPALAQHGIEHTPDGPVIQLSESTLAAIDNGVSLTFVCDYAVLKPWLFFKWPEQRKQHQFIISKHALSDRYLVHQDNKATPSIFRSSSKGVAYISKAVQNLFRGYLNQQPETQLRISLNKYDLPAPMRLTAFTSTQWNFDSGWGTWQPAD